MAIRWRISSRYARKTPPDLPQDGKFVRAVRCMESKTPCHSPRYCKFLLVVLGIRSEIGRQRCVENAKCHSSALRDGQDALKLSVPCDNIWPVVMGTMPGNLSPDAECPRDFRQARTGVQGIFWVILGGTPAAVGKHFCDRKPGDRTFTLDTHVANMLHGHTWPAA